MTIESYKGVEKIERPKYRLMITRHAERLPSGQLSPEGVQHAKEKGKLLSEAEVVKAYASDHKSGRAYDTGDFISKESGVISKASGKQYKTREVPGIQYDVLEPDLYNILAKAKDIIEEQTLKDIGWSTERDEKGKLKINIEKLSISDQEKIAPIRQKNQVMGFRFVLNNDEAVHRMAMGLAHQLIHELEIIGRYDQRRKNTDNTPEKNVIINTATHGLFMESLLKEAGILITEHGEETIKDFESADFGGYIQPAESIYANIDNPQSVPEKIPVMFEGGNRPKENKVFIDLNKLKKLAEEYERRGDFLKNKKS